MRRFTRWTLALALLALLAPGGRVAAQGRPGRQLLASDIAAEVAPVTDGATVAWAVRAGDGTFDLRVAPAGDPLGAGAARTAVAGVPAARLAVDGDYLLWGSREETAAPPRQQLRAIHLPSGRIELLADLSTLSTSYFDVDSGRAVWNEEQQIKSVTLGSGEKAALVEDIGENAQYTRPSVSGINLERAQVIWKQNTGGQVPTFELRIKRLGNNESNRFDSGAGDTAFDFDDDTVAWWEAPIASEQTKLTVALLRGGLIWKQATVNGDALGGASPLLSSPYIMWLERGCPSAPGLRCERIDDAAWATHVFLGFTFKLPFMPLDASQELVIWTAKRQDATDLYAAPLSALLPTASAGPPPAGAGDRYFPETGHAMPPAFAGYWQRNGATPVFGLPLTGGFEEVSRDLKAPFLTQYTERQRFEAHPENQGTAYEVLLGRLGAELLAARGRDWRREGPFPPEERLPGECATFAETGREVCGAFLDYWRGHGLDLGQPGVSYEESLALFGLPLTVLRYETNPDGNRVLTQWFERARFEWHPGNPAPYKVLLGRLGAEALAERGW